MNVYPFHGFLMNVVKHSFFFTQIDYKDKVEAGNRKQRKTLTFTFGEFCCMIFNLRDEIFEPLNIHYIFCQINITLNRSCFISFQKILLHLIFVHVVNH